MHPTYFVAELSSSPSSSESSTAPLGKRARPQTWKKIDAVRQIADRTRLNHARSRCKLFVGGGSRASTSSSSSTLPLSSSSDRESAAVRKPLPKRKHAGSVSGSSTPTSSKGTLSISTLSGTPSPIVTSGENESDEDYFGCALDDMWSRHCTIGLVIGAGSQAKVPKVEIAKSRVMNKAKSAGFLFSGPRAFVKKADELEKRRKQEKQERKEQASPFDILMEAARRLEGADIVSAPISLYMLPGVLLSIVLGNQIASLPVLVLH